MKLVKRLLIANSEYGVCDDRIVLVLSGIGRATFMVECVGSVIKKGSLVTCAMGYSSHDALSEVFRGFVESVTVIDNKRVQVFCRELIGVMAYPLIFSLRHPDLIAVLASVTEMTGLVFSVPEKGYASLKVPNFANHGSGLHLLSSAGKVFNIVDFMFQQQGDGVVFVGSWVDSRWADRDVDVPSHHFTDHIGGTSARMAISPALRPGVVLNGQRVKSIEFAGSFMTVGF